MCEQSPRGLSSSVVADAPTRGVSVIQCFSRNGYALPSTTTDGTRPSVHPRAGLGAVHPKQPAAAGGGTGNDARPGGIWEVLTSALIDGVPALLDEVRTMLGPVAPEYAEYLIEGRADVVVAAEAAMAAFVEHAQRCLSRTQSPEEVGLLPDTVLSMFEEVGRTQWSEGFALRTLLSAYQVGGRVAWHHVAATSLRSGVGAEA